MNLATPSLFDQSGKRLYLTPAERARFINAANRYPPEWRTLAKFLVLTGCRISEALSVRAEHFDFEDSRVAVETLKQRRRGVWRRIPLPKNLLAELDRVHGIRQPPKGRHAHRRLWVMGRTTSFERIKRIMLDASIAGPQACPKGLRHTFGVHAILAGVPITSIQVWMGHARLETTQIYLSVGGQEEYEIARRMWQ